MLFSLFTCVRFMLFMLVKFSRKKSLKLVLITSPNILLITPLQLPKPGQSYKSLTHLRETVYANFYYLDYMEGFKSSESSELRTK